ncbi:hypothetical protein [Cuneatibacter caecimuris]|uniref:hypothetical protein n=1 Tax=Cuneatibacter caecimuris TaxID=1796618 RepID=UPI0013EEA834|nr:hypothetical protein [Cuneatibacter caecimuris]
MERWISTKFLFRLMYGSWDVSGWCEPEVNIFFLGDSHLKISVFGIKIIKVAEK